MSKGKRIREQRRKAPPPVGKTQQPDRRLWIGGGVLLAAVIAGIAIAQVDAQAAASRQHGQQNSRHAMTDQPASSHGRSPSHDSGSP